MNSPEVLEAQIDRWRDYVRRHRAVAPDDVDEMTDHLRERIDDLRAAGLDDEEAFLVAVKRMGRLDAVSREFARAHSERLWKQLVLLPDGTEEDVSPARRELAVVLACAVGAGLAVKAGATFLDEGAFLTNLGLLVAPFVAGYLGWKRRLAASTTGVLATGLVVLAAVLNLYPYTVDGSTLALAALHAPVVLWALVGVAYAGGRWRSPDRRMDFVRFTGELAIYFVLLALGGGVLVGLTAGLFSLTGLDLEPALEQWILPVCVPGAFLVAAWLVEAKQEVVENIAPVLTRVFTPLTTLTLVACLVALATAGDLTTVDRELLILMDGVLLLVLALVMYSVSARDPLARPGLLDGLQLGLVTEALAVDAVALTAMLTRIAEFGASPNKVAALGLNLLLAVHLARSAWLLLGMLRHRRAFGDLERWQTAYLPVYAAWAVLVVVAFGPLFGFV
ncbi:permease prefix domain 1-containing protein [Isoptericola sp. 178]|uniref:permease prefix domain 1-containing protein n=1 Tax=Isoptericola sp. 178 TaxID=3064651 RepID=UPI0027141C2E|nr:permease prefix domain 1-containing protein [Isoptericola sp. 178]MDO8145139.1 permease prefix domain 1-containing protein [Isoptericola sp. 178]